MTGKRIETSRSRQLEQIAPLITLPRIQKLLSTLVRIPSTSGEEASLQRFLEAYLAQRGVNVERQQVVRGRYNLIAHGSGRNQPGVLLNTHVDTVPAASAAGLVPRCRGNFLYGRGACDAKGSVAAMVLAFLAIRQLSDPDYIPVDLCLTVGEESTGDGSERYARDCQRHVWAIVGEPTSLRIVNCHAGFVELMLAAGATAGHAFDPAGEQAITAVAELILEIKRRARRLGKKPVHAFVDWIEGGNRSPFWSIRPTCKASVVINTYSKAETESMIRLVRTLCANVEKRHRGVRVTVDIEAVEEGLQTPRNSSAIGFLSNSLRELRRDCRITTLPSWTDGARWCAAGIPTVVFGPGSLKDAHTDREKVDIREIRDAALAMTVAILTWREQTNDQRKARRKVTT